MQVISEGKGELVVVRRPLSAVPAHHFLPCEFCMGFYNRDTIYQHHLKCCLRPINGTQFKNAIVSGMSLLTPFLPGSSQELMEEVIAGMKETKAHSG